uniref:NfeD family protein n=1 Tax=Thaumasiovibrio occultus TaxID=1891184 RepID=UPI000B35BE75|nr:nodulation protein NfeD [Thaumasiovibrio occultus]
MKVSVKFALLFCAAIAFSLVIKPLHATEVWVIPIDGAIGPATADFMVRELEQAQLENADLVILRMDTPGGLDVAMRDMIQAITNASIPVATWVAPSGARAASAGTYILFASHIATMAQATNLGAATPVSIGGGGGMPSPLSDDEDADPATNNPFQPATTPDETGTQPEDNATEPQPSAQAPKSAMEQKVTNDARAYITGLARLHGRNEEWAQLAVTEAASIDAIEALEINVIDFIANNLDDVVANSDGRTVLIRGEPVTLSFDNPQFVERVPDWRAELLAVITNPNVAYLLLMIGIYGLILEFYNPGIGLPGVLGGICLLLAMYALQMLPVSYAGLALIILGIALMLAEAFSPSFGLLGIGGVIAFIFGSIFLLDTEVPGFQIALPLIAGVSLFSALLVFSLLGMLLKVRRAKVTTGREMMIGRTAVINDVQDNGKAEVMLGGERWQVESTTPLHEGQKVIVTAINGLTLVVRAPQQENKHAGS